MKAAGTLKPPNPNPRLLPSSPAVATNGYPNKRFRLWPEPLQVLLTILTKRQCSTSGWGQWFNGDFSSTTVPLGFKRHF